MSHQVDRPILFSCFSSGGAPSVVAAGAGRCGGLLRYDLGYICFVVVLFQEVFFSGARFIARDLLHYIYPIAAALAKAWAGTGSFLWDSGIDHGIPLAARWVPAVFYPPHALFGFMSIDRALAVVLLIHFPIAASATFRLALRYTPSKSAAWVAGLGFAFGGYLLSVVGGETYLYGAALLPLSLLSVHRLIELPRLSRALQLGIVIALQILVPDPQTLFFEMVVWVPLVLWFYSEKDTKRLTLGWFVVAAAVGLGLSFCQLWPTVELASLSVRANGFDIDTAAVWSFHPLRLVELVVPGIFGTFYPDNTFWAQHLINAPASRPWALSIHLGLLPLLALVCMGRIHRRGLLLIGGLALFFALLAMGTHTPLFGLVLGLPGVNRFRYPEKYLLFATLATLLLGAMGLGRLLTCGSVSKKAMVPAEGAGVEATLWRRMGVVVGVTFAALVVIRTAAMIWPQTLVELIASTGTRVDAGRAADDSLAAVTRVIVLVTAVGAVLLLRRHIRPKLLVMLLLLIACADVLTAGLPLRLLGGKQWLSRRPELCRAFPTPSNGLEPLVWRNQKVAYYDVPSWRAQIPSATERFRRWQRATLKPNVGAAYCVRYVQGYDAGRLRQHDQLIAALHTHPAHLLDVIGVQAIIDRPGAFSPRRYPLRGTLPAMNVAVYENSGLPFAYSVPVAWPAASHADAVRHVADTTFELREAVVLEAPAALLRNDSTKAGRHVTVRKYRPGYIEIETDYKAAGYTVVLESFYPGWEARVERDHVVAQALPIWRANGAFMGLATPAGKCRLTLLFHPGRQRLANWVTVSSLLAVFLAGIGVMVMRLGKWWSKRS